MFYGQWPLYCQWGEGGPYAGTLLLYAQEIAMNNIWTEEEYKRLRKERELIDTNTMAGLTCNSVLLHAFHNSERFGKYKFLHGEYSNLDMADMDLDLAADYATYLALKSAGQGKNRKVRIA